MKVLLLELNEITWRLLDPLIDEGRLPTFRYLKEHGAWGTPVSVDLPPNLDPWITWTTVYSGKPQSEHGVHFLEQPPETVRTKRVWDLVVEAGLSVGIYGSLNSWPPRPVKGFWIPGTFAQDAATYPEELRPIQELNLKYTRGYNYGSFRHEDGILRKVSMGIRLAKLGLQPTTMLQVSTQVLKERFHQKIAWKRVSLQPLVNFDFFSWLYGRYRPHLATFHTNHVAHYQHLYWRAMEPTLFPQSPAPGEVETYGQAIEYGYCVADRLLQRALRLVSSDTALIVASSMGQQPYINHQLDKGKRLRRLRSFDSLVSLLGLEGHVRILPTMADQFNIYTPTEEIRFRVLDILANAYVDRPEQPMFSINRDLVDALTVTINQFNGMSQQSICHFTVDGTMRGVRYSELVEMLDHVKSGFHHPEGMIIFYGAGVQQGPIAGAITNLDLAPTILSLLGLPVPSDLTGRILPEALGKGKPHGSGSACKSRTNWPAKSVSQG